MALVWLKQIKESVREAKICNQKTGRVLIKQTSLAVLNSLH